ncbi:MAG: hypothetical protein V3U18_08480 [Alphaproteobacteria bacterium]
MPAHLTARAGVGAVPLTPLTGKGLEDWLAGAREAERAWVTVCGFAAKGRRGLSHSRRQGPYRAGCPGVGEANGLRALFATVQAHAAPRRPQAARRKAARRR